MTHPELSRIDAENRMIKLLERPYGNPTFGEKQEIANIIRALREERDQARAALAAQVSRIKAIDATTSAVGPDDEYGKGAKWILAEVLALIEGDGNEPICAVHRMGNALWRGDMDRR